MTEFNEGEVYELDELPDSEMCNSGKLEMVGDGRLAGEFDGHYVTFEWAGVRVTDVTAVEDL